MTNALRFDLALDPTKWVKGFAEADRASARFGKTTAKVSRSSAKATEESGKGFSELGHRIAAAGAVVAGIEFFKKTIEQGREAIQVSKQTEAVIKSTGGAAHVSAGQFEELAHKLGSNIGVADSVVQSGENILATFTGIKNTKTDKVFDDAEHAAIEMTAALNHGVVTTDTLQASNIRLGRALQDPVKGITALQRVGVQFTAQQRDQIKTLVASGNTLAAQKIILAELGREFGGVAEASATSSSKFHAQLVNLQEGLGKLLIPALDRAAAAGSVFLEFLDRNRKVVGPVVVALLGLAGTIGTILAVSKAVKATGEAFTIVRDAATGAATKIGVLKTTEVAAEGATADLAVAEEALAAKTAIVGTAAEGSAVKVGLLKTAAEGLGLSSLGLVGLIGGVAVGLGYVIKKTDDYSAELKKTHPEIVATTQAMGDHASRLTAGARSAALLAQAQSHAAAATGNLQGSFQKATAVQLTGQHAALAYYDATRKAAVAQVQQNTALQLADSLLTKAGTDTSKLVGDQQHLDAATKLVKQSLQQATTQLAQNRAAMATTIESYQGLITKSGVTAKDVVSDLHNQVANFKTYARDAQRLIRAGVDPSAIQELSQKGPQYVHALATGTNTQLGTYKKYWKDRQSEVSGEFATAMDAQYKQLKKTITDMQNKINTLSGKRIYITAQVATEISTSVRQYLAASHVPGFHAKGARIAGYGGGDTVPAMLEPGEAVVPKEAAKRGDFTAWAGAMGIPGYQLGGLVGSFRNPTVAETTRVGESMGMVAEAVLGQLASGAFTGGAASGNVIALALAQARRMHASFKVALALIEAGIVESGLRNLPYGDRDSLGFLQQRPSQGWAHPMDISYAAWDFLHRAIPIQGRYGTAGALAQAVQRSAYPGRYDLQQARALGVLSAYGYDRGGLLPAGTSIAVNTTGRAEPVGIDYDRLATAVVGAMRAAGVGQVVLDGQRVDRAIRSAAVRNDRLR